MVWTDLKENRTAVVGMDIVKISEWIYETERIDSKLTSRKPTCFISGIDVAMEQLDEGLVLITKWTVLFCPFFLLNFHFGSALKSATRYLGGNGSLANYARKANYVGSKLGSKLGNHIDHNHDAWMDVLERQIVHTNVKRIRAAKIIFTLLSAFGIILMTASVILYLNLRSTPPSPSAST